MATTCELIGKVSLGSDAANIEFTSIPGTYTDLVVSFSVRSDRASNGLDVLGLRLNAATTNYSLRQLDADGAGGVASSALTPAYLDSGRIAAPLAASNVFASGEVYIPNYAGSANKSVSGTCVSPNSSTSYMAVWVYAGLWSNTAAITALRLYPVFGSNFKSGSSAFLYGITKA